MSSFSGLQIAAKGLLAQQAAMETVSHNIANVNTDGYTRQEAVFQTTSPIQAATFNGLVGTGVQVAESRRVADNYLNNRVLDESAGLSFWESKVEVLNQVEGAVNSMNLPDKLNSFWTAWHELSLNPDSTNGGFVVQQEAISLVDTFTTTGRQLLNIQRDLEKNMVDQVNEANTLAEQIAQLNTQISLSVRRGQTPNDLLDKRTMLLKEFSGIVGGTVIYNEDSTVNVYIGTQEIINGNTAIKMLVSAGSSPTSYVEDWVIQAKEQIALNNDASAKIILDGGIELSVGNGALGALLTTRDQEIVSYIERLDQLAVNLVDEINALHYTGYTDDGVSGVLFFQESTNGITRDPITGYLYDPLTGDRIYPDVGISNMQLSSDILSDTKNIALNTGVDSGKGENALNIYNLMTQKSEKFGQYLSGLLTKIGSEKKTAESQESAHQEMLIAMRNEQAAISGVNMDEELSRMIQYERAYQASARAVTVMDEMLDTLINRMMG